MVSTHVADMEWAFNAAPQIFPFYGKAAGITQTKFLLMKLKWNLCSTCIFVFNETSHWNMLLEQPGPQEILWAVHMQWRNMKHYLIYAIYRTKKLQATTLKKMFHVSCCSTAGASHTGKWLISLFTWIRMILNVAE